MNKHQAIALIVFILGSLFLSAPFPPKKIPIEIKMDRDPHKELSKVEVLIFKAKWCRPCHDPKMKELPAKLSAKGIKTRTIDVDQNPQLTQKWKVQVVPTTIVTVDGQEVDRKTGVVDVVLILKIIAAVLKKVVPYLLEFWGL